MTRSPRFNYPDEPSEKEKTIAKVVDSWLPKGPEFSEIRAGLLRDLKKVLEHE